MIVNNSEFMSNMFSTKYKFIYFIVSIKLLFINIFIRSFDY